MSHGDDELDGPDGPDDDPDAEGAGEPDADRDDDADDDAGDDEEPGARRALHRVGRPRYRVALKRRRRRRR
jgi:hypothetical protein